VVETIPQRGFVELFIVFFRKRNVLEELVFVFQFRKTILIIHWIVRNRNVATFSLMSALLNYSAVIVCHLFNDSQLPQPHFINIRIRVVF